MSDSVSGISIKNVEKIYANRGLKVKVFQGISCDIKKGEFVSIVGPSGCGKSTLLRIIAKLLSPDNGKVIFEKSNEVPEINIMFQDPLLLPWRTVRKNIALPLEVKGKKDEKRLDELLKLVNLSQFANSLPKELSGGMKQRVALARSLVTRPDILLMDEPFGALDELTRSKLNFEFQKIWQEIKFTCLLVTHSISEAVLLSDRIIILSDAPAEIKGIVSVQLPRPRGFEIKDTQEFMQYAKCVRNILKQENL